MDRMAIERVAQAFRASLEDQQQRGVLPGQMERFPAGCCGVVSDLLGEYLNQTQGLALDYVWGQRGEASHAWLEGEGLVIDITGDQFPGRPAVFIGPKDAWYRSWEEELRHLAVHEATFTYADEIAVLQEILRASGLPEAGQ